MERTSLIHKMEGYIQDFRAQLEKNDPASLSTLTTNTRHFFAKLLKETPAAGDIKDSIKAFSNCIDQFEQSCAVNDKQSASKSLTLMEETVRGLLKRSVA